MSKSLIYYFIFILTLFYIIKLNGQDQVQFKHLNVDDGLSNGRVTSIVQDSIGFIWVGTKNGLNRYDANSFKVYNQKNSGISSNDISVLKIDKKGNIWIGTVGGGINIYNPVKDEFTVFKNDPNLEQSISSNVIHTIFEDINGNIWIGTENGLNLFLEATKEFKSYTHQKDNSNSISHNSVWSIFEQENGVIWVGTYGGGLNKFTRSNEKFKRLRPSTMPSEIGSIDFINTISSLTKNELLIGTNGNGLIRLNTIDNTFSSFFSNTDYDEIDIIRTISKDEQLNVWIGTDGHGVLKISNTNNNTAIIINQYVNNSGFQESLTNNTVNTIFNDNQANIWIGTAWKGLNIIEEASSHVNFIYSDVKGNNASPVLSVFKDGDEIWMGTDGLGLSVYNINSKEVKFYNKKHNTSIGGDYIQKIKPSKNKQFWIGTFAHGLILYDSEKNTIIQYIRDPYNEFSLPYNDVRDFVELPLGDLLVGTWGGGLSYFNVAQQKFTNFKHNNNDLNSLSSDNVTSLLLDKSDKVWVATYGGGLNLFDIKTKQSTRFLVDNNNSKSIGSNYVFSILKDKKNEYLWLGTKEGLNKFDLKTQQFEKTIIGNTVNTNTIVALIQDDEGNIWMSTKEGIFKYNYNTNQVEAFPGIIEEFHINSVFKDAKGILYFGGIDRVVSFNPIEKYVFSDKPSVIFSDFKLFDKKVDVGKDKVIEKHISYVENITLNYDQDVFSFSFTALQYPNSDKTPFAIKMDGFDDQWREVGTQNTTTFTNLSPGNYIFKVKSQMRNGTWNEDNAAQVNIKILPPYWKTWWAYMLYFIVSLLLLFVFQYYSIKWSQMKNKLKLEKLHREQEDKLHKLKQRFFTDISHEIRTPLTLILGSLNGLLLKENNEFSKRKPLLSIKKNTDRLLNLVNELLNFRKLETGGIKLKISECDIIPFVNEIYLTFSQQAIIKKIDYQFLSSNSEIPIWIDKIQMEKTIFNLLSNAFKFSQEGGIIKVMVSGQQEHIKIVVSDTGQGIPKSKLKHIFERFYQNENNNPEQKGFGIGLSIAKDIVRLHSGTIEVQSELDQGSSFTVLLPKGNAHFKSSDILTIDHDEENIKSHSPKTDVVLAETYVKEEFSESVILIIEDNPHIREYLKVLLSKKYKVIEASNGREGLDMAIEHVPDLVISDIMMPIMDGMSFCYQLKTDIRISHIPVMILTGKTLIADKIEGYETGADEYLTKPFNEEILQVRVKNLLKGRSVLREKFLREGLTNPKEITLNSPDEEFLSKLVNIIEENIEESEFNIDQLSRDIGMSHSNVYKKLKALTGMTIIGFVKDFRLKRASQLLEQNKISITDVCFKVGYTDRRHFSQEFKKKFGISPSQYARDNAIV